MIYSFNHYRVGPFPRTYRTDEHYLLEAKAHGGPPEPVTLEQRTMTIERENMLVHEQRARARARLDEILDLCWLELGIHPDPDGPVDEMIMTPTEMAHDRFVAQIAELARAGLRDE
jgi:hypothetical protein